MTAWAGARNRVSLDKLCKAFGIETPKGGIDGSKVWDYVKAGKIDEVAAYCARDVEATRKVYKRLTFAN
jgi:predicted PolB exonuclease-like 3'-5' exonuclease